MKYIEKSVEPKSFTEWRSENRRENWDNFSKTDEYKELKSHLSDEQEGLCCYCEVSINGNGDTHIEHHKPKSKHRRDTFKYQNLFACCQKTGSCGHKKQGDYFTGLVSPLSNDCQDRFIYTGLGNIIPKDEDDSHADRTIDLLGLDCKYLRDQRKTILRMYASPNISDDYIIQALDNCRGWHNGFYTVVESIATKRNIKGVEGIR